MTPEQVTGLLTSLVTNGIPAGIFAFLFIYLFLEVRKESAKREQQSRDDRAADQTKADLRETWFRGVIEKFQATQVEANELQRRTVTAVENMERRLERMETAREGRRASGS